MKENKSLSDIGFKFFHQLMPEPSYGSNQKNQINLRDQGYDLFGHHSGNHNCLLSDKLPLPEYIAISKSGPSVAIPGDLITYTLSVGNGSQNSWTGTITDVLPAEFTYDSSNPPPANSRTNINLESYRTGRAKQGDNSQWLCRKDMEAHSIPPGIPAPIICKIPMSQLSVK